jgi:hypothetical protein
MVCISVCELRGARVIGNRKVRRYRRATQHGPDSDGGTDLSSRRNKLPYTYSQSHVIYPRQSQRALTNLRCPSSVVSSRILARAASGERRVRNAFAQLRLWELQIYLVTRSSEPEQKYRLVCCSVSV